MRNSRARLASSKRTAFDSADAVIAVSDPIANNTPDWSQLNLKFTSASDGIILQLTRDNCGQICPAAGSIGFDDISLRNAGGR